MVFSSHLFLFYFLPFVLALYYAMPRRGRHVTLTLLSYVFYGWANPWVVFLMMYSTLNDYVCGLMIAGTWNPIGTLDAPDEKAGQVVTCPSCGGEMLLPAAGAAPAGPGGIQVEPPAQTPAQQTGATKSCPHCGEQILAVAQKCKHCGTFLSGPMAGKSGAGPRGRSKGKSSGEGTKALIFGIVGLLICAPIFGPMAIVYGYRARKNEAERGMGTAGMILGIVDVVLFVIVVLVNILVVASGAR